MLPKNFIKIGLISFLASIYLMPAAVVLAAEDTQAPPVIQSGDSQTEHESIMEEIKLFSKALGVIEEAYPGDINVRNMLYEAVKGMLDSLDKYTEFIDPKRYEILKIHMRGEYAGIGVMLKILDDYPAVKSVKPDSAAHKHGLMPDDKIIRINGASTLKMSMQDASALLRGEEASSLVLTLQRDRENRTFDVEMVRERIEIESVQDPRLIGKSIGYLRLDSWQDNSIEQMDKTIAKLRKQGMKAIILDLRNNDGGLLPKAVELAERFLPKGAKVVSVNSKIKEQRKDYQTSGKRMLPKDLRLVILVNERSASASEIFSAAMQDHKRATIIGIKTYGKASVQSVIPLDDNSAMKMTTARYLSPLGRDINQEGLTPDEIVENGPEGAPDSDHQIVRALEILRSYR